jgi:hypothetical protein
MSESKAKKYDSPGYWGLTGPILGSTFLFIVTAVGETLVPYYGVLASFLGYILGAAIAFRYARKGKPNADLVVLFLVWIGFGLILWIAMIFVVWFLLRPTSWI